MHVELETAPVTDELVPAGQALGAVELAAQKKPAAHSVTVLAAPAAQPKPAAVRPRQARHVDEAFAPTASLYVPAEQCVQDVAFVAPVATLKVPAGQGMGADAAGQ